MKTKIAAAAHSSALLLRLTPEQAEDLRIRAAANDISAAEYVRRALAAVASVGGADEYVSRAASKRGRDKRDSQTKGKKK
jgi:hypothetical protein